MEDVGARSRTAFGKIVVRVGAKVTESDQGFGAQVFDLDTARRGDM